MAYAFREIQKNLFLIYSESSAKSRYVVCFQILERQVSSPIFQRLEISEKLSRSRSIQSPLSSLQYKRLRRFRCGAKLKTKTRKRSFRKNNATGAIWKSHQCTIAVIWITQASFDFCMASVILVVYPIKFLFCIFIDCYTRFRP